MKKNMDEVFNEMTREFERLPSERQKSHLAKMKESNHSESTSFYKKIKDNPAIEEIIKSEAESGNSAAMLLISNRFYNLGIESEGTRWLKLAHANGSGEAAFILGFESLETDEKKAFSYLSAAFTRSHEGGTLALATLCGQTNATRLGITEFEFQEIAKAATKKADKIIFESTLESLLPGTHPVQYIEDCGIPWGTGTLFLIDWKSHQFAITATHVIRAANAKPEQVNLLLPGRDVAIPILKDHCVDFQDIQGDYLDIYGWELDRSNDKNVTWYAWDLNHFWRPVSDFQIGTTLFVLGYPNTEDKIDYEKMEMQWHPLVVRGKLSEVRDNGHCTIDCADFSVDVDGMSGSPVFAFVGGMYFFVGLAQWGGTSARKLHFLDAAKITTALDLFLTTRTSIKAN
jgi:hypothetical protein